MAAISQKIPNLVGGVSQQPDSLKLTNQLRECINYYPDPTFGLAKRPGIKGIGKLSNAIADGTWFVTFRDEEERYIIEFGKNGTLRIWDAESGVQQTVNTPAASATTYATHTSSTDLSVLQINDYTFVLNRKIAVQEQATTSAALVPYGFVVINSVGYNTEYKVTLDTTNFSYTTPANITGNINSIAITTAGSGYVNGTYTNVPLIYSTTPAGSGIGAKATVVVSGGAVTGITVTSPGSGYKVNEVLTVRAQDIGGTGSGATFTVNDIKSDVTALTIDLIISNLVSLINAGGVFAATGIGNSIHIQRVNNADFSIKASGGQTGNALEAYKGAVSSIAELPRQFLNDKVVQVLASAESTGDDYYVKFKTSDGGASGAGVWEETIGPGVKLGLNPSTMPHAIIREANGTFTYRQLGQTEAGSITPTANVTGVPTAVSITTSTNGRYSIGESFPVYGGSGLNLRLRVTDIRTDNVITNYTYSGASVNFIEKSVFADNSVTVTWYLNNQVQRITSTDSSIQINNLTISKFGAYTTVTTAAGAVLTQRAGVTTDAEYPGRINGVEISRAGRGYTASNVVTSDQGDTFTINTVATVTQAIDSWADNWWQNRNVGDAETNPPPTFVSRNLTGMSFFKNRLVLMAGENVICSQAGSYFDFYASTVITSVDSDPIDISCGSLKPIEIRYAIQMARGLALFADNAQYILETTTDAFSAATAEINLIGAYNQDPKIAPVDIGSSVIMTEQGVTSTGVFEILIPDQGIGKVQVAELTRIIPSYLPSDLAELKATSSASTFGLRSRRDPNTLYLFRFFNSGSERQMAAWFKWTLPGDIDVFEFEHDRLFVVYTTATGNKVLGHVNLLTDSPGGALFYDNKFIDLRLDCYTYNPTTVYHAGSDMTRICFKDATEDSTLQPCLVSLDPLEPGVVQYLTQQYDAAAAVGQKYYIEIEGDQTSKRFALGYQYLSSAVLPAFYVTQNDRKDTLNVPRVNRLSIDSYDSGPFEVTVSSLGRDPFTVNVSQIPANLYPANTLPVLRNAQNKIPIMAKGTEVEVNLQASSPFPSALTSIVWEGTYNNKGIRSI